VFVFLFINLGGWGGWYKKVGTQPECLSARAAGSPDWPWATWLFGKGG
jgi:hypothetical protein